MHPGARRSTSGTRKSDCAAAAVIHYFAYITKLLSLSCAGHELDVTTGVSLAYGRRQGRSVLHGIRICSFCCTETSRWLPVIDHQHMRRWSITRNDLDNTRRGHEFIQDVKLSSQSFIPFSSHHGIGNAACFDFSYAFCISQGHYRSRGPFDLYCRIFFCMF